MTQFLYSYTIDPKQNSYYNLLPLTNIVTKPGKSRCYDNDGEICRSNTLVTLGDTITYTTILTNSGNTNVTNITTDLIPDGCDVYN